MLEKGCITKTAVRLAPAKPVAFATGRYHDCCA